MLYLSANSENVIYTEVSANKTLSSPTYLMSLTHAQTGKRWSFIPQNVTSISGTPYNARYDLFKFNISATTENLSGGTCAWYWQHPPCMVYEDARFSGTNQTYVRDQIIVSNVVRNIFITRDFSSPNEQITGGTLTADGVSLTPTWNGNITLFGNVWSFSSALSGPNYGAVVIDYEFTTNSGNTYSDTIYTTDINEVYDTEVWRQYGTDESSPDFTKTYPLTYLTTPVINIDEIGEFTYSIREQLNPINLNPSLAMNQLEVGLAYITEGFTDTFYSDDETIGVYNPD